MGLTDDPLLFISLWVVFCTLGTLAWYLYDGDAHTNTMSVVFGAFIIGVIVYFEGL